LLRDISIDNTLDCIPGYCRFNSVEELGSILFVLNSSSLWLRRYYSMSDFEITQTDYAADFTEKLNIRTSILA
jgi:hypothetical protein